VTTSNETDADLQMADGISGDTNLKDERDRAGKAPLTKDERLVMLGEIYDGLLFSWRQNVTLGFSKGSSAISYQLERARLEMIGLSKDHGVIDATSNHDKDLGWRGLPEVNASTVH